MRYYRLNNAQEKHLRRVVPGLRVSDLGSGDGSLSLLMSSFGAAEVHSVDKACRGTVESTDGRVKYYGLHFHQWKCPDNIALAVLSWPEDAPMKGLISLLEKTPEVIYLGKNTDGVACGFPKMYRYLSTREVRQYLPDHQNVMIHYGPGQRSDKTLHHEEMAGIFNEEIYSYCSDRGRKTARKWLNSLRLVGEGCTHG